MTTPNESTPPIPSAMTLDEAKRYIAQQEAHDSGDMAKMDIQAEITQIDRAIWETCQHIKVLSVKQNDFIKQRDLIPMPPAVGEEILKQARKVVDGDKPNSPDSPAA